MAGCSHVVLKKVRQNTNENCPVKKKFIHLEITMKDKSSIQTCYFSDKVPMRLFIKVEEILKEGFRSWKKIKNRLIFQFNEMFFCGKMSYVVSQRNPPCLLLEGECPVNFNDVIFECTADDTSSVSEGSVYDIQLHFTCFICERLDRKIAPKILGETIVVNGIEVSKAKLICSSPVFEAMFRHDMKEALENKVEIKEVRENIVALFVEYINKGYLDHLGNNAIELFDLAEKYQMEDLKDFCIYEMLSVISSDTVVKYLIMLDTYNYGELKEKVIDYFHIRSKVFSQSKDFDLLNDAKYLNVFVLFFKKIGTSEQHSSKRMDWEIQS